MASDNEASCVCDPNFAVICSFLEKFAKSCGITHPNFLELQEMLENSQEVPQPLVDLHVKLLRKARKSVSGERWERALIKFCHSYSNQDGWEVERFGYKKARLAVKLRILKMLLELQFDLNAKFKTEINRLSAEELRSQPLGRDKLGQTYWCQLDEDCNLRVYREDLDDETWEVVAKDREGMVQLIAQLSSNDPFRNGPDGVLNDDSNSLEIEKPIIDTGQVVESPADEDEDGEFEEVEDEEEESENIRENDKKNQKQLSEPKTEKEKNEKSPVKDTKTESHQSASTIAAANGSKVSDDKSNAKKKTESEIAEGNKSENSLPTDKNKHSKPETLVKDLVPDKAKELSAPDDKKDTSDSNETDVQNKSNSGSTKDEVKKLADSKTSSETKKEKDNAVCANSAVKDSEASSSLKLKINTDSKKKQETSSLSSKEDITTDKTIHIKKDGNISIKGIPLLRPCITLRPIEQLVAKDRLPTLKLLSDSIIQKHNSQSISLRDFNLDSKDKISQNVGRKNSMDMRDYPHQNLKSGEMNKSIVKESTPKNIIKPTNMGQKDETRNLHPERTEWKEGAFDLRPPMMKSGNGNRGLDLSGRKVPGIGFGQTMPIAENLHKTQDNICDLSMKRPVDNYSVMKDTQRHSMNVLESPFYQNSPTLDLTLKKPNISGLNFSHTKLEDRILDSSSKVELNPNISTDSLKSLESLVRDRESKDGGSGGTKRDLNDIRISQAKKPRFDNFQKTTEIGDAIEEPLMLIRGEGSGKDCNEENSCFNARDECIIEVSEAVEDPVLFIQGEGCGADCDAGNTGGDAESGEGNKSGNTPDERKSISVDKKPDKSQESSSKEFNRSSESSSSQERSMDSSVSKDTPVDKNLAEQSMEVSDKSKIDQSSIVERRGSLSLTPKTEETSSTTSKINPTDRSVDGKPSDGQLLVPSSESSSTKDEKEISEPSKILTEATNINKPSASDKSGSQIELAMPDKGMKESINTKLKQFHSTESPHQSSSNQSHPFPINPPLSSSRVPPLPSSGTLNLSQGAAVSGIEVSKSIPSEGSLSIERLSHSHHNNPHSSNLKLQETSPVSSMFPHSSSHHKPGNSDVLDMSVRKENLLCISKGPGDTRKLSSSTASSSLDTKSDCFMAEKPRSSSMEALSLLNVELDKMKPDPTRSSEAPLPVTKRFLHQTSNPVKPIDSVTLKIPEPDKGDRGKISPTKTPPKLWSIETICAPDQKQRESRDVLTGECGTSNPLAYHRPELADQSVPKQKWPLGVQIIPKSTGDNASLKKSRWDIGRPTEDPKPKTDMKDDISRLQSAIDPQKDSRNLPKDVTSKVPIVDSFALSVDRISKSAESEEHIGRKIESSTSSLLNKMPLFSSSGLASNETCGKESSLVIHPTICPTASSPEKMSSSHSNYPTSGMNMPLDVRLPRKHEHLSDVGRKIDLSSDSISKSNLSQESQNINKPSNMSLHVPNKNESFPADSNSSKPTFSGKDVVDSSISKTALSEKDKHGSLLNQNIEVDKKPAPRFFFGPGCLEFPDKKNEAIDKMLISNTSKIDGVHDKRKGMEEKRSSTETMPVVKKDVDKITAKSEGPPERNIGKVIDFLTQKNTGKSLGASTDKVIAKSDDKSTVRGLGSAVDRGRKSIDGPGERSIDKVIGLLTEKSARLAETKSAEKSSDVTKEVPTKQASKDIEKGTVTARIRSETNLPSIADTGGDQKVPILSTHSKEKSESHIIGSELHTSSSKTEKTADVGTKNLEMEINKEDKTREKTVSASGIDFGKKTSKESVTRIDTTKKNDERIVGVAEGEEKKTSGKNVTIESKSDDPSTQHKNITITSTTDRKDETVKSTGKTDDSKAILSSKTSMEKAETTAASLTTKTDNRIPGNSGKTSESVLEKPVEDSKIEQALRISSLYTCKNDDKSDSRNVEVRAKGSSKSESSKSNETLSAEKLSEKVLSEAISDNKNAGNDVGNKKTEDKSKTSTNENISKQETNINLDAAFKEKILDQQTNVVVEKCPLKPTNINVEKLKDIDSVVHTEKPEIKKDDKPLDKSGDKSDGKDVSSSKANKSLADSISSKSVIANKNTDDLKSDKTLEKTKVAVDPCISEETTKNMDVSDKNSKSKDVAVSKPPANKIAVTDNVTDQIKDKVPMEVPDKISKPKDIAVSKPSEHTVAITDKITDEAKDKVPMEQLDKNCKPEDVAASKSSDNTTGVTGKVADQSKQKVPTQSPPADKDNTMKKPDISDKNIIKPIPILASKDIRKKIETPQMKESGKGEKLVREKVQDNLKDKVIQENQKADLPVPVPVKPVTIQGKNSPGNISGKMGQQGMMGGGKGRRKSVENITMGIMMSKLAGKTGLDSQTKFPVSLPAENQATDKVTSPVVESPLPEKPIEKQEKEPAILPEKPTTVSDTPPVTTEKAETPPKRTGFITLKPIETLLEKPRVKFQDVKDVKHDFGFVTKPMEGMPLPEKPYLYPVSDVVTERIADKIKTVPGLGVTPIIRHPLDQQKIPSHPGTVQPLKRPGAFTPADAQKEMLGRHGSLKPELKRSPIQKGSVTIEGLQKDKTAQDDKSVNKGVLLPSVQSSEKLLQTLNTSVSIVEKPVPVKEVECDKIQQKMDGKDKRQDISVITKDLAKSPPKVQTSSKIQTSPPTKVPTIALSKVQPTVSKIQTSPKSVSKVKETATKVIPNKEVVKPSESKDNKKVTGDKSVDNKLLKSSLSATVVTNIDKKKENTETKVASMSKSASVAKPEEDSEKGKLDNTKSNSVPLEKDVTKAAVPSSGNDVKSKEANEKEAIKENSAKSDEVDSSENKAKEEVKDEKTEKEDKKDVDSEDLKPKKEEISTGITLQSLAFDYTPDPEKDEKEIESIRTRFTRSHGKPAPQFPVKPKRGKGAKAKASPTKEETAEKEEPPLTRSRRTRSGGPPPVNEPKKPANSKEQTKKANSNKVSKTESNEKAEAKAKPVAQKRRNSRKLDSQSDDEEVAAEGRRKRSLADSETAEDAGGKRRKLRSKRTPDLQLRRSIEEQKLREGGDSSSDDDRGDDLHSKVDDSTDESQKPLADVLAARRGRPTGRARGRGRGRGRGKNDVSRSAAESPAVSSDAPSDTSRTDLPSSEISAKAKSPRKSKARRLLGLDVGVDIILEETKDDSAGPSSGPPVRASRRIAQIKIKEEAERRKIEEITLIELKEQQRRRKRDEKNDKDYKGDKKKRKKKAADSDEDYTAAEEEPEEPTASKKKKKKRKKRKKKSLFCDNPWQSTSGSSSSSLEEEEEEEQEQTEEEEEGNLVFKSDHEFSPESDLENEASELQPTRRARTAVKVESEGEEPADDHACQKCGKSDHPEWILLCDKCDSGWHGSCLRPALMVIPEGDWFCPPCEHTSLLTNLEENLREYDKAFKRRENEELRRKRLAYVGISLDNVLPNKDKEAGGSGGESGHVSREESSSSSESGSTSSEESEPLYHLRERRQTLFSYRFNEYDDLINSAIQDEMDAVKGAGNQGRGKDIATIVNAEKEEMAAAAATETAVAVEKEGSGKKMKGDDDDDDDNEEHEDDEEEEEGYIPPVRKFIGRKKHRRLNSLDISSEDDADSDEDFKGSSSDEEEEDEFDPDDSDDSDAVGRRRGGRRGKHLEPVRRSTRARTTRFDKEFINDDSDDSVEPRRKKTRRLWQESESSESDSTWGRKKKRKHHSESFKIKSKKKKKKNKHSKGSDGENPRNKSKNPRIKYGGLDDDDDDDDIRTPRTRGKKINYQEEVGSDSEEELMKAVAKAGIESEDEYVASEEEEEERMMEDEEEEEPDAEELGEEEEDEADVEGAGEGERKAKSKEEEKTKTEKEHDGKLESVKEKDAESMVEKKSEEPVTPKPEAGPKVNPVAEPEIPVKEVTKEEEITKTDQVDENVMSPKGGKKRKEKGEKKPKTPRKPREKKPKPEKQAKIEKKPPKPRAVRAKKQIIRDDIDDELGDFGEDFDDLEEGEIRLGAMLDEREELMDDELLDDELMDEEKEMEDMLEEELLDEDIGIDEDEEEGEEEEDDDEVDDEEEEEEEEDLDDEDDELLAMREAELAHQQAELEKAKEMKRLKKEAKKLEKKEQKKRGRKAKQMTDIESSLQGMKGIPVENERMADVVPKLIKEIDQSPPKVPPIVLPLMSGNPIVSPLTPKRKGRGRGKAALAAAAAADTTSPVGGPGGKLSDPSLLGTSMLGGVPPPRYPGPNQQQITFPSNSSVISRMLQSQPVSGAPQSFTAAAAAMGHKYFGGPGSDQPPLVGPGAVPTGNPNTGPSIRGAGPVGQSYSIASRGRIPSPYRQPPPLTSSPSASPGLCLPQFAGRGSPVRPPPNAMQQSPMPSLRMRTPAGGQGPQMYHTSHHPLDPSPSGGGPISIASNNGVRPGEDSPLHQPPAQIPPAAGSPLAGKSGPPPPSHTTPPPPPYTRGGPPPAMHQQGPPVPPPLIRFPLQSTDVSSNGRHPQSSFPPSSAAGNHLQAQPSPPPPHPGRSPAPGNFSPYHPPPPPNYHYGAYPPPPPLAAADDALPPSAYQGSPYPDHYASPDATHSLQASDGSNSKSYDEEGGGEFGGLVSYFSSQREDDLDT